MFKKLIQFEWHYHTKNSLFYAAFIIFFILGFFTTSKANFSFPGVYRNSPYVITYIMGLLSLGVISSMTLLVAQTLLRDKDTKMDSIIYVTPVAKLYYLGSKFLSIFGIGVASYGMLVIGMMIGYEMPWIIQDELGPFSLWYFIAPFLMIAGPNIFLCAAVLCGLAWITRSKLFIYVGGLFIYIIYVMASVFSNSPIFAGASASSAASMALVAKLDPFGLASFFEQTHYWTAFQRNSDGVELTGNFLFNRIIWISISVIILIISYQLFSFRKLNSRKTNKEKEIIVDIVSKPYKTVGTVIQNTKHTMLVLISFVRIDLSSVLKGIPFLLIMIMLNGLLVVELYDLIDGGIRSSENIATTGLMTIKIMEMLPFVTILVLLFYSNELLWRSTTSQFSNLEDVTPSNPYSIFFSKLISLTIIPFFLITSSILIGIAFQIIKNNAPIDWGLYRSMYYYIGLPMFLVTVLLVSIQVIIPNKYIGLTIAAIIVFIVSTSIGKSIGIRHTLFQYAHVLKIRYYDMNGFGNYTYSFGIRMLYNLGLAIILILLSGIVWKRTKKGFPKIKLSWFQRSIMLIGIVLFFGFGSYIFYKTNIETCYLTSEEETNWDQEYELKFRKYENLSQPIIVALKADIDLFPEEQRYKVKGSYLLVNKTDQLIDRLLIYRDENAKLTSVSIPNAKQIQDLSGYGHYWYQLEKPLHPKDTLKMDFTIESSWSPFVGHIGFNSIIDNGSFMRISRYFPVFGYQSGNEIQDENERTKRKLGAITTIKKLEDKEIVPYDFIDFETTVSTTDNQIVVGSGNLVKQWKKNNRNYFQYKTDHPIPFRFAFSSARYQVKKELYKDIMIEVYFDPRHGRNVDELMKVAKTALDYCQDNFGKYPYKVLRYAEISSFADGFAATAYPTTLFMKENFGFYSDCTNDDKVDVLNQITGHELSHQWWGNGQLSPEQKEGGILLTETLAQYTELMLYGKRHGKDRMLEAVKVNLDLYLSGRGYQTEKPLYKMGNDTPYLAYNKGTVVMHQLRLLIGEDKINTVLQLLIRNYAYPNPLADSQTFLNEIYKVTPLELHSKIDEMFKQIITYTSKIESVRSQKISDTVYEISFVAESQKFSEKETGERILIPNDRTIDIGVYDEKGMTTIHSFQLKNNKVSGKIKVQNRPIGLILDPDLKNIDTFNEDNEKEIN